MGPIATTIAIVTCTRLLRVTLLHAAPAYS
jgi:hypothetical protein